MSITNMSKRWFRWVRRTEYLVRDVDVTGVIAPLVGQCPQHDALVEVRVRGANITGTVTLAGDVAGVPGTEVLTFSGATPAEAIQLSCDRGRCVDAITATGFGAGTTIEARYVGPAGNPIATNAVLVPLVRGFYQTGRRTGWAANVAGSVEEQGGWIAFDDHYGQRPRPGDVFVELDAAEAEVARWEVFGRPDFLGSGRRHHYEVDVRRVDAADVTLRPV